MRSTISMLLVSALLNGCSLGETGIRRGTPITHVQTDFGEPDVISDSSGDLTRFYVPTKRPKAEWPWDAPRTFYYLDRNLAVIFERGKAVRAKAIDAATREQTLEPLVERHGAATQRTMKGSSSNGESSAASPSRGQSEKDSEKNHVN